MDLSSILGEGMGGQCSYSMLRECPYFFFMYFSYTLRLMPFPARTFRILTFELRLHS